jgi:hypothetical protein
VVVHALGSQRQKAAFHPLAVPIVQTHASPLPRGGKTAIYRLYSIPQSAAGHKVFFTVSHGGISRRGGGKDMKKLHAGMLHHGSAKMPVHEAFVHHFRLPRRGEEMAHFLFFAMQKHSKKSPLEKPERTGWESLSS